jgi:uncharacterized protein
MMTSPTPPEPPPRRSRKSDLPRDDLGRLREPGRHDAMAHLRDLPTRIPTADEALRRGLRLFDEERFFESYVHLALAWKRTRAPEIRGLVQVAGGLCHVQRGNPDGARAVLAKAVATLAADDTAAEVGNVDIDVLLPRIQVIIATLDRAQPVTFPRLPRCT